MTWEQFLQGAAIDLQRELTLAAPFRTGTLRNSIKADVTGDDEITVTMVGYGKYVEYGTPPHTIRATEAKALHWKDGKGDHFAKEVHHPGTRPNPFIRHTLHTKFNKILKENFERHVK